MLVPLQVLCALRVIGVIGVPAPVCNSSDQLDLLQTSRSEVAVTKMKVRTLDSETRDCLDVFNMVLTCFNCLFCFGFLP